MKTLCREFVTAKLPHELGYFDSVWDAFWMALDCQNIEELPLSLSWMDEEEPIRALGAISGQQNQVVDSLYAIGTLCVTAARVMQTSSEPDFDARHVHDVMMNVATSLAAPKHISNGMEPFVRGLHSIVLSESGIAIDEKMEQVASNHGVKAHEEFVVQGLYKSKPFGPMPKPLQDALKESKKRKYDIVVDEPNWTILTSAREDPLEIPDLEIRQRYLLWFAVTNVGNPPLDRNLFFEDCPSAVHLDAEHYHQELGHLADELGGDIRKRMISHKARNKIFIPKHTWSYYWIRSKDEQTRLLYDVPPSE